MHRTTVQNRFLWLVYDSPQRSQIMGAVNVGIHFESAVPAFENLTSPFTNVMAFRTSLGGVGRVYNNSLNTSACRFVLYKTSQLPKGPTAQLSSEPLVPFPVRGGTDMGQIFNSDSLPLLFGTANNRFADGVVDDGSSRPFSAGKPFQQFSAIPSGGTRATCLRAFALNRTPYSYSFSPVFIYPFTGMCDLIRGHRNIGDTQVTSDKFFYFLLFRLRDIYRLAQIKLAFLKKKVCFTLNIRKIFRVKTKVGDADPATHGPDRNAVSGQIAEYPGIIGDGAQRFEPYLGQFFFTGFSFAGFSLFFGFFICFVGVSDFSDAAHRHLGRKIRRGPGLIIATVMQIDFIKAFFLPGYCADTITNRISLLHRLKQQFSLISRRVQFYFQRQFHSLLSNEVMTFALGGTAHLPMSTPSYATKLYDPNAAYLRPEKYFDIFLNLICNLNL
jgi:hypothetical protein